MCVWLWDQVPRGCRRRLAAVCACMRSRPYTIYSPLASRIASRNRGHTNSVVMPYCCFCVREHSRCCNIFGYGASRVLLLSIGAPAKSATAVAWFVPPCATNKMRVARVCGFATRHLAVTVAEHLPCAAAIDAWSTVWVWRGAVAMWRRTRRFVSESPVWLAFTEASAATRCQIYCTQACQRRRGAPGKASSGERQPFMCARSVARVARARWCSSCSVVVVTLSAAWRLPRIPWRRARVTRWSHEFPARLRARPHTDAGAQTGIVSICDVSSQDTERGGVVIRRWCGVVVYVCNSWRVRARQGVHVVSACVL